MARDVEVNVTANDRTGNGLAAAERAFKETARRTETESDKMGRGLVSRVTSFAPKLTGVLTSAVGTAAQAGGPLLAGGLAYASPLIASSVAGGIIGGVGIGGVVGGLVVASKDPRVAGAIKGLGDGLSDRLEDAAGSFIQPALDGVAIVDKALASVDLEGIFEDSSRYVVPLAEGVGRAIEAMGDGIEDLAENAGPVIDSIADGIGDIGEEIGEGLSSLADNGEAAADSLDTVFTAIGLVTDATFGLINGLMEAKEWTDEFAGGVFAFDSGLKILNDTFGDGSGKLGHYVAGTRDGSDALDEFQESMEKVTEEMLAQTDPLFGLMDAQRDVTEAQKAYNKALKDHGPKSSEAKEALANLGQAAFRLTGKVGEAAGKFDGRLTPAMRTALENAGLTRKQIERLEKQLRSAAKEADDWEGVYTQKYVTIRELRNRTYDGNSVTGGRATGGPVMSGEAYLVGENGPEILQMGNRPGNVVPNHALGGDQGGDLYLTIDLGEGIRQRLRVDRRDLKRRTAAA